jgi:integrase
MEARYWFEGRRRSVYGKNRKEVAEKLVKTMAAKEESPAFVPKNVTLGQFLVQYEDAVKYTMKRRSFETYLDIAWLHLLPTFGNTKLEDLTREQVQRMYVCKRDEGLSAARVRRIHGVLSAALNHAVLWRLVEHNVCKEVSPPRVPPPEIRPLSLDEAKRFLVAAEGDRFEALYVLGLTSGMRFGELGGLFWSDMDLDRRMLRVQRALITGHGRQTLESPKTPGRCRGISLTPKAVDALLRHRKQQRAKEFPIEGDVLVFTNGAGNPVNPSHLLYRSFKPLLQRAGLPDTTFHAATRHTYCCILLMQGVNPKAVSLQLGHSSVALTLQKYAHFLPGFGDNGAMDAALS